MTRTIGLSIAVVLVLGLGAWVYFRKRAGKSIFGEPPLYSGYGPGPQKPMAPPAGKAPITNTLQDINSAIQGGDQILMTGKKAWDDLKSVFGNTDTTPTATLSGDDWA